MSVRLSPIGNAFQFLGSNGRPLSLGNLYTYAAGTSTPQTTYSDSAGSVPNANPIALDSSGRLPGEVWLTTTLAYKFVLKDAGGSTIGTYDNITGIGDAALGGNLAASSGSSLVGFLQSGTGAAARTVQDRMRDWVSVKDFGAKGDGSTDDTTACQNALNTARGVYFPSGTYKITSGLAVSVDQWIRGDGPATIIAPTGAGCHGFVEPTSGSFTRITISDMQILGGSTTGSGVYFFTKLTYNTTLRNLTITMGSDAIRMVDEFHTLFDRCFVSSSTGHGFFVNGGNSTTFLNCYASTISTAGKAGYRVYAGAHFISCNGVDSGSNWGIFGSTVALDGVDNTYNCVFERCNIEAFSDTGCLFRFAGYAKFDGGEFVKTTGTYTTMIDLETATGQMIIDGTSFFTGGTRSKLADIYTPGNNFPIFVRGVANITNVDENGTLRPLATQTNIFTSWTPTLAGATTAGTNTYSTQSGWYRVDGRMVTAYFSVSLSANTVPMVGSLVVAGLPFPGNNSLVLPGGGNPVRYSNITLAAGYTQIGLRVNGNSSVIQVQKSGTAVALGAVDQADINATTGAIEGWVQYQI